MRKAFYRKFFRITNPVERFYCLQIRKLIWNLEVNMDIFVKIILTIALAPVIAILAVFGIDIDV